MPQSSLAFISIKKYKVKLFSAVNKKILLYKTVMPYSLIIVKPRQKRYAPLNNSVCVTRF